LGSNLRFVAVTDELDNDTYQGAENNFNKTTPSKAIAGFNGYINQFPRGIHALQNYYLAQLHYAEGAESKSILL
jgi:TolA-binding protein